MTHEALSENLNEFPLSKTVARALGHYGMQEQTSQHEKKTWDGPVVKAIVMARIMRAARRLSQNYVKMKPEDFVTAWWKIRDEGTGLETTTNLPLACLCEGSRYARKVYADQSSPLVIPKTRIINEKFRL